MCNFNKYIIDKNILINNVKKIKRYVGRQTKICAVVKADAYGLGVKNVCPFIADEVDYFAVVSVKEAMEIRAFNSDKPIVILGVSNIEYVNWCAKNNVDIAISSIEEVKYIGKYCNNTVRVHLKINSGMNRYGIKNITQLRNILKEIRRCDNIDIVGVYTHFATKSSNLDFIEQQYNVFEKMLKIINIPNLLIHCANSFVSTTDKLKICNMVRIGFSLYSNYYERLGIKNVLSLKARILYINNVKKGESVGYDRTYIARKNERIAVVSMGYADGFMRSLSNNFKVLINGQYADVVGNICMDCFMVNITNIKGVLIGSEVTILGDDGDKSIDLTHYAKQLNTSPYEILTNFRRRRFEIEIKNE